MNKTYYYYLKEKRIEELAKPDKNQKLSIITDHVFAFFGGLIAIFIGWHLFSHKKHYQTVDKFIAITSKTENKVE